MQHPDRESLSQLMDGEWHGIDPSQCAAGVCQDEALRATWARYHLIRDAMNRDGVNNEPVHSGFDLASRVRAAIEKEPTYSNVTSIATDAAASLPEAELAHSPGAISPQESASAPRSTASRTSWRQSLSGLALAASVALVTVVGLNIWRGSPDGALPTGNTVADATSLQTNPLQTTPAVDTTVADATVADTNLTGGAAVRNPGTQSLAVDVLPQVEYVANRGSYWVTPQAQREAATEERLNMFLSQHIEASPTADHQGMLPYSRLVGYDEIAPNQ